MGARQRAQKRGKGPPRAVKGGLKGSPALQKDFNLSVQEPYFDPIMRGGVLRGWQNFAHSYPSGNQNGYSMSQQARNTERHVFGWGSSRLRDNAITFVSAGHLHQDQWQEPTLDGQKDVEDQDRPKREEEIANKVQEDPSKPPQSVQIEEGTQQQESSSLALQPAQLALPEKEQAELDVKSASFGTHRARSASVASSDSEQIIFTGRSNSRMPAQVEIQDVVVSRQDAVPVPELETHVEPPNLSEENSLPIQITSQLEQLSTSAHASPSDRTPKRGRREQRGRRRPQYISDEEEAIMQDYIANMAVDDSDDDDEHATSKPVRKNETLRFYSGSGEENAKVQLKRAGIAEVSTSIDVHDLDQAMDWNSDDLEIFDNASTTDGDVDEVEQILRQRERKGGLQYLVIGKGLGIEDARWIPHARLVSTSAIEEIRIFEELRDMDLGDDMFDGDMYSSNSEEDEALNDLMDNIESEDDENAKIMAQTSRMTDEQIARALAKQDELGMGADELLLFGDEAGLDGEDMDDVDAFGQGNDFIAFSTKQHISNRTKSTRNKKRRDIFPPASAFADALDEDPYGGFDIMDFDRSSLRPRKKGRKSGFPYDLEVDDTELKDQLVSTWLKDREKKALRKREREEAKMAAAVDASERSQPAVIKGEIRRFLCQEIDVLRLAPMDSATRASVHRLAKALRLNSRSEGAEGKGAGRYPVLTKTPRTPIFTINTIWEVDALLNTRKFFPKNSTSYKTSGVARGTITRAGRSGGIQGATYMNGEVVGASAPEIGADNKGRAMLEKMGWTSGMGIGAEGNKGGLEAIKHVVKTTKAGLG